MNELFSVLGNIVALGIAIVALITAYSNYKKSGNENIMGLKDRTIQAHKELLDTLEAKVQELDAKMKELSESNSTLVQTIELIKTLLLRRGFQLIIDGDIVTFKDEDGEHSIQRHDVRTSSSTSLTD